MRRELEQEEKTLAAERGRSPSDAASVFGGGGGAPAQAAAVDRPEVVPPAAEAASAHYRHRSPRAVTVAGTLAEVPQADEAFPDEEPFPEEPFEEVRRPRLVGTGKSKGRRLVKPEESPQPAMTPEQRLLILDTWQRSGLPAGDFAAAGGRSPSTRSTPGRRSSTSWGRAG